MTIGPLNKLLLHLATGVGVDVFATGAESLGKAVVVRERPGEFNVSMMSRSRELGMAGHAYSEVTMGDEELQCPTEESVFDPLERGWIEPGERR